MAPAAPVRIAGAAAGIPASPRHGTVHADRATEGAPRPQGIQTETRRPNGCWLMAEIFGPVAPQQMSYAEDFDWVASSQKSLDKNQGA